MNLVLPDGFRLVRRLGEGGQASVILAQDTRARSSTNCDKADLVAIKCYPRRLLVDERKQKRVKREVRNLRLLNHPHIIGFREALLSDTHLCLVLNYASGGALFDILCSQDRLEEKYARWFFQQLILAVDYAHRRGITNRDVKPENILLQPLADDKPPFLLLCDFGLSRNAESGLISRMEGTFGYVAPELYIGQCRNVDQAKRAEIYSCGVCLFQMLFGLTNWPPGPSAEASSKPGEDFLQKINTWMNSESKNIEFPSCRTLTPELAWFLKRILQPNPQNRITMTEIWGDPWFNMELPPNADKLNTELIHKQKEKDQEMSAKYDKEITVLIQKGVRRRHGRLYKFGKLLLRSVKKNKKTSKTKINDS